MKDSLLLSGGGPFVPYYCNNGIHGVVLRRVSILEEIHTHTRGRVAHAFSAHLIISSLLFFSSFSFFSDVRCRSLSAYSARKLAKTDHNNTPTVEVYYRHCRENQALVN